MPLEVLLANPLCQVRSRGTGISIPASTSHRALVPIATSSMPLQNHRRGLPSRLRMLNSPPDMSTLTRSHCMTPTWSRATKTWLLLVCTQCSELPMLYSANNFLCPALHAAMACSCVAFFGLLALLLLSRQPLFPAFCLGSMHLQGNNFSLMFLSFNWKGLML